MKSKKLKLALSRLLAFALFFAALTLSTQAFALVTEEQMQELETCIGKELVNVFEQPFSVFQDVECSEEVFKVPAPATMVVLRVLQENEMAEVRVGDSVGFVPLSQLLILLRKIALDKIRDENIAELQYERDENIARIHHKSEKRQAILVSKYEEVVRPLLEIGDQFPFADAGVSNELIFEAADFLYQRTTEICEQMRELREKDKKLNKIYQQQNVLNSLMLINQYQQVKKTYLATDLKTQYDELCRLFNELEKERIFLRMVLFNSHRPEDARCKKADELDRLNRKFFDWKTDLNSEYAIENRSFKKLESRIISELHELEEEVTPICQQAEQIFHRKTEMLEARCEKEVRQLCVLKDKFIQEYEYIVQLFTKLRSELSCVQNEENSHVYEQLFQYETRVHQLLG